MLDGEQREVPHCVEGCKAAVSDDAPAVSCGETPANSLAENNNTSNDDVKIKEQADETIKNEGDVLDETPLASSAEIPVHSSAEIHKTNDDVKTKEKGEVDKSIKVEGDVSGDAPAACSGETSLSENDRTSNDDVKIKEEDEENVDKSIKVEADSEEILKTEEATIASKESSNNASVVASSESTPDATNVQNPQPTSASSSNKATGLPKLEDDTPASMKQERSDSLSNTSTQDKPHTRSRTRSLSSAVSSTMSSISGASGEAGERISRGPAKKRHKARALFGLNNDTESAQDEKTNATSTRRPRSNTIDSFRAAMDHQSNDLPTSSIVLPQIKQVTIVESNNTTASPPSERFRSDTIDFLNSSGFHTTMSGSPSPRSRGDTIDFLNNSGDGISIGLDPIPVNVASANNASTSAPHVDIAHKKTPKKTNRTRASSQSSGSTSEGPLRKRRRTRSLQFKDTEKTTDDKADLEDNDVSANDSDDFRIRSNTFDYSMEDALYGRSRSDTLDFLTAAVAGDMGHDLDAASAAAAGCGSSFAMHPISAPSGASAMYHPRRPRSNTIDSTTSSLNSTKLDFLVSVAAEDNSLLKSPEQKRERGDSSENVGRRPRSNTLEIFSNMAPPRDRGDTVDFLVGSNVEVAGIPTLPDSHEHNTNVMDHLQALCDEPKLGPRGSGSKSTGILRKRRRSSSGNADGGNPPSAKAKFDEETARRARAQSIATLNTNFTLDTAAQRLLSESLNAMNSGKRHRLESWGGMSDISAGGMENHYSALRDSGLIDDIMAVANEIGEESIDGKRLRANSGGSGSSGQPKGRPRFDSLASLSLASLSDASVSLTGPKDHKHVTTVKSDKESASTTGNPSIVVDFAAIAAGVDAANAAIEGLDLTAIMGPKGTQTPAASSKKAATTDVRKYASAKPPSIASRTPQSITTTKAVVGPTPMYMKNALLPPKGIPGKPHVPVPSTMPPKAVPPGSTASTKPLTPFPVTSIKIPFVPIPKSTKTKEEMDAIMQRARAAAGYTPPTQAGAPPPVKKVPPRKPPTTYTPYAKYGPNPAYGNTPANQRGPPPPYNPSMPPHHYSRTKTPPSYVKARIPSSTPKPSTLQSQQKWDDMFNYLVKFIEETRQEATKNLPEEKKKTWVWDGNVPTNYKTKCGKALGRWINNQRSAKSKGTLKDDREVRLVSTGLKWSVLTTNSWRDMLRELQIYVTEQTKDGRPWDGNVPTNYKIKSNTTAEGVDDEEKNLGRWINRQRSLFQAGKLKKERQLDLERIGLKWSVLLTTSWTTMYDGLCAFVEARRKQSPSGVWDGDVPPNYKTNTNPPLSLGRWVHRQRSAQAKGQLKDDQVQKLEMLGLKWFEEGEELAQQSTPMSVTSSSTFLHQSVGNQLNGAAEPDAVTSTSEC